MAGTRGKRRMGDQTGGDTLKAPSRSAKKRESAALQKLGVELSRLSAEARKNLNLPPELLEALDMHDRISDREGARRQRQYIGKIMRSIDPVPIQAQLARLKSGEAANVARFHRAEKLRDTLLAARAEDLEQMAATLLEQNGMEHLKAHELLILARKAREQHPDSGAKRDLFRHIMTMLPLE